MLNYKNIDEFIKSLPENSRPIAEKMRQTIAHEAPQAVEAISYGIPTFKLGGKNLVHFSVYAHHVGFYPGAKAMEVFKDKLTRYKTSKGTVQFALDEPVPYELVKEITRYRVTEL